MASPTLVFNSSTGSDTAASGAGPATALTGTAAASRGATTAVQIGFFETDPDLSGVATDSSHVLWVDTASGKQYSDITAKRDVTTASTTGDITSGAATLTIASGTGIANGDLLKVAGAGAAGADYYSTVSSGGGTTTLTMADNAGTTVTGAAVTRPKQVTVGAGYTVGQVGKTWAIGGKRKDWDHADSRTLFVDARPGWTIQTETDQSISSAITYSASGTGSGGLITITGSSRSPRPIITQTANAAHFTYTGGMGRWKWLDVRNSNATKTNAIFMNGAGFVAGFFTIEDCILGHATNKILTASYGGAAGAVLSDCEVLYCTGLSVRGYAFGGSLVVVNCNIHDGSNIGVSEFVYGEVTGTRIWNMSGDGINDNGNPSTGTFLRVSECTIHNNTGDGIDLSTSNNRAGHYIVNNTITANGNYGIRGRSDIDSRKTLINYNNFGTGATANTSGSMLSITAGANDLAVDPGYTNASTGDFRVGTNLKAKGNPTVGGTDLNGAGNAVASYQDVGSLQRLESGGGVAGGSFTWAA